MNPVLAAAVALLATTSAAQSSASRPAPRDVETQADGSITLRGRVVLTDVDGKQQDRPQGRGALVLWRPGRGNGEIGEHQPIDVLDGEWSVVLDAGAKPSRVSLSECEFGERAVLVEPDGIPIDAGAVLTFRLRALPDLRLRVVEAGTRKELERVDVHRHHGWGGERWIHPGGGHDERLGGGLERVVTEERSPVVVPATRTHRADESRVYWIRAPGYAWQSLHVLAVQGGEREVVLERGGTLQVRWSGAVPKAPAKVFLRLHGGKRSEGAPLAEFAVTGERLEPIEGLRAGTYDVRLELGEWFRDPRVLARGSVTIEPDRTAVLELQIRREVAPPPAAGVRGTLVIPTAWLADRATPSMSIQPLARTQHFAEYEHLHGDRLSAGEREGEYRFQLGLVAGTYVATVSPGGHAHVFTVAKEDATELRIEVPPPVDVVFRIVDGATGAPRNGVRLLWNPRRPLAVMGGSLESATAAADSNVVRIRAPQGTIDVFAHGDDFEVEHRSVRVTPEKNEFELKTRPVYGVKVELYEGSTRLPLTYGTGWKVSLEPLEGKGRAWGSRGEDTPIVKDPGRYVLRVTAPDGWEPVADRQVTLQDGPFPTIEIKVKRKP